MFLRHSLLQSSSLTKDCLHSTAKRTQTSSRSTSFNGASVTSGCVNEQHSTVTKTTSSRCRHVAYHESQYASHAVEVTTTAPSSISASHAVVSRRHVSAISGSNQLHHGPSSSAVVQKDILKGVGSWALEHESFTRKVNITPPNPNNRHLLFSC
jgi:hypothetical protein